MAVAAGEAQAVTQAEAQAAAERVEAADIVAAQTPEQAEIAARLVQAPLEEPTTMGIIGQLGYVGQPIGLATALLQRGLWNPKGMVIDVTAKNVNKYRECACQGQEVNNCCRSRDMVYVMSQQPDFLKQRSALQELVYRRGRTYRNLYHEHGNNLTEITEKHGMTGYGLIEKMCKKASTHRNIVEQEINFLNDVLFA